MSDKVVPFTKMPSKKEALEIVRHLVEAQKIRLSAHALKRMSERKVSFHQIVYCLTKGHITEGPFQTKDGYEMRMERGTAGDWIRVVLCLRFRHDMLIISVINDRKGTRR